MHQPFEAVERCTLYEPVFLVEPVSRWSREYTAGAHQCFFCNAEVNSAANNFCAEDRPARTTALSGGTNYIERVDVGSRKE